jgi:hypothetical protein
MATARFRIKEHTLPTTHIREYPRATAGDQEDVLHLAIKQYIPLDSSKEDEGDVTLVGAHANGFPKVLRFSDCRLKDSIDLPPIGAVRTTLGRSVRST